jgi:pSer/pThr/pTyr-binding forkhead associated (FHA) protein
MEPKQDPRAHDLSLEALAFPGELVVQNGRLSGTRCPLRAPLTLIGRGEDCDIRVNVDGVGSLHCAISLGPEGACLRRLNRKHETRVNGERVSTASLQDGDSITVGPCRFQLRLRPAQENHTEKDALRIQAAAVAAQQAALFEEETRLQQRRVTLERQEKELVAHLEEKRSRFLEAQSQLRRSHAAMQQEWARYEQRVAAMTRRLEVERRDVADSRRQVQAERRRLLQLRQRMKRRWHRFWAAERAAMQRKEQALQQQAHRLEQEKEALLQARQRFHGAAELERRQLQEQWDEFRQEQKRWEQQYIRERAELAERAKVLDQRETDLAAAERAWAEQKQHLEATRAGLEREIHGLENRIRHQRQQLRVPNPEPNWFPPHEQTLAPAPPVQLVGPVAGPRAPVDESLPQRWAMLAAVAGELADQRLHLLEHWQRLIQTHHHWQQEREGVTTELEAQAQRLQEREQALDQAVERCRLRHDEILHLQRHLDSRQAQLTVQAIAWAAERDRGRAEIQAREDNLERRLVRFDQRRQLRQQRQRQGLAQLRAAYALCARLREEYGLLRRQWLQRTEALVDEEKKLTQRALVLEQYRQKYLDRASDPAEARTRLENLQQRAAALFTHADESLRQHRQSLQAEIARLEERHRFVDQAVEKVLAREAELCEREGAWEHQQALTEHEAGRFRQEIQRLQGQQEVAEQQIADLRDEVEHLARQLLAEEDFAVLSVHQAA